MGKMVTDAAHLVSALVTKGLRVPFHLVTGQLLQDQPGVPKNYRSRS